MAGTSVTGRYLGMAAAIVVDALIVAVVCAVAALAWWLAVGAGGQYLETLSDTLFYVGGIVLTIGAMIAFFRMKWARHLNGAIWPASRLLLGLEMVGPPEETEVDAASAVGVLLVFIGALLIVISLLLALI
ncbi:MAG TPA: hypothetical protein VLT35_03380 [Methanocella sp.]|nr:hypothetical protein [Methanocella sp.]